MSVAEALIRLAATLPLRVLCTREFQNSIKDSSHRLLKDTIDRLGMGAWFEVTNDAIRSYSGGEFIFKGLHGNEEGIKSTEGVDICWVEEGQTVSARSWQTLIPTIRKALSEIWVTYNLLDENDATHRMFVVQGRGGYVRKVNYDSNPLIDQVLLDEMERDKALDQHLYEHIWLGEPLKISDAVVLNRKYVVREFPDDLWTKAERPFYGLDFGYSQDPSALLREFVFENRLYIDHEAYQTGVELNAYPEFLDRVPGSRDWPIKCDNSQPALINHLRREGFNAQPAEKWDGSVKDGVTHLRGYAEIVIHPRCVQTAREARLWRWKVDPKVIDAHGQPQVLPVLIDKHNHSWDAARYGLDGHITRGGELGQWARLGQ